MCCYCWYYFIFFVLYKIFKKFLLKFLQWQFLVKMSFYHLKYTEVEECLFFLVPFNSSCERKKPNCLMSLKTNVLKIEIGEFKNITLINSDVFENPRNYFVIGINWKVCGSHHLVSESSRPAPARVLPSYRKSTQSQQLSESLFCILPNSPPCSSHWFALQNNYYLSHRITCLPNCRIHGGISYPFCPCWCTYFLKLSFMACLRLLLFRLSTGVQSAGWGSVPWAADHC